MYRLLIVAFVCIRYMSCKNDDRQLSLLEVPTLSYQDTMTDRGKEIITHSDSYVAVGFQVNNHVEKYIDSIIINKYSDKAKELDNYFVTIYKYSSISNPGSMKLHGDRYSQEDIVYSYDWRHRGLFLKKYKYRNGKIIETGNKIQVENVDNYSLP